VFNTKALLFLTGLVIAVSAMASSAFAGASLPSEPELLTNQKFSEVAIAIASPGPGSSVAGHAFLLFLTQRSKISEAVAVQYNVEADAQAKPGVMTQVVGFLGYGKRFLVQIVPGLVMLDEYSLQNRAVFLYFLKLNPEQIQKLQQKLITDFKVRDKKILKDYRFLDRNCLTEALRALNSVIPDRHLQFSIHSQTVETRALNLVGVGVALYVKNAPYVAAPMLARHPLVTGVLVVPPEFIQDAPLLVRIQRGTENFAKACPNGAGSKLSGISRHIIANDEIRESKSYLKFLRSVYDGCHNPRREPLFSELTMALYMEAKSIESKMSVQEIMP
jgi:hypothetical protein